MRRQPHFESKRDSDREINRAVWRDMRVMFLIVVAVLAAMGVALLKVILYP